MDPPKPQPSGHSISPLVLAQIIIRFGDAPDPASRSTRYPLRNCPAEAYPPGDAGPVDIQIADLSLSGIGFTTDVPMEVGDGLLITLTGTGIPPQRWSCQVARAAQLEPGVFRVGAMFTDPAPA